MVSVPKMKYRLGLDLGTTSIGWAMIRLNADNRPCAVIRSGVRIFSDGRVPKTGQSLAVERRLARQQRRTRDRKLRRKYKLINLLVQYGFFPEEINERRKLERLDPYQLRVKGLDEQLHPAEFARAIFHLGQRRGFKSNRKADSKASENGLIKDAIRNTLQKLQESECRTIGEWLYRRHRNLEGTRARTRTVMVMTNNKSKKVTSYDLYLNRQLVHDEFVALWESQKRFDPELYGDEAKAAIEDAIFFQRDLRPVKPGRCTLLPEEERAPLALPSQQRFRIYQEVNNLRKLDDKLNTEALTLDERNVIAKALESKPKMTFDQIRKLIRYGGQFNLEDEVRKELKGNATSVLLGKKTLLGDRWHQLSLVQQDEIVKKLLDVESEEELVDWLVKSLDIAPSMARTLSELPLPSGYGALSEKALNKILPILMNKPVTYDKAVLEAGFEHHSNLAYSAQTGEILPLLPYYGQYLQRHVGFGTNNPTDPDEIRYGKIANPTVHIGLNQVRVVVNELIKHYGHPSEIIVEVARDLKLSREKKLEVMQMQAKNKARNDRIKSEIATALGCDVEQVTHDDIEKWILWEELNPSNAFERLCPYSGKQISVSALLSDEVEIEHILPFSRTLDDSRNNKTVSYREANRIKGNSTPWEAKDRFAEAGWDYEGILARAERMSLVKRARFSEHAYANWLRNEKDFVARSLNDTAYLSRIAKEYLSLICPTKTRCIPGTLTAKLRAKFGLNSVLGLSGEKNRNDHRHHAVDACVIAVTDQSLLQRISSASARSRQLGLSRLIDEMPLPWETYRDHVYRAVNNIVVSHRPDHSHEGAMHDQTAYGIRPGNRAVTHKSMDGQRVRDEKVLSLIRMTSAKGVHRHGLNDDGSLRPYKGYKGNSNYCLEIYENEKGKWVSDTISTFQAYQIVKEHGVERLRSKCCQNGKPLVMRLMINDCLRFEDKQGQQRNYVIHKISGDGRAWMADVKEANVRMRVDQGELKYVTKTPGALQSCCARRITVSPVGGVRTYK